MKCKLIKHPFTLIEIMAVVVIILILMGIAIGGYNYAQNSSKDAATKALIKRLEVVLGDLKAKHGYYPGTGNSDGKFYLYKFLPDGVAIEILPSMNVTSDYKKDFARNIDFEDLKSNYVMKDSTNAFFLIDAWGNQIYYLRPGKVNKTSVDIVSAGSDGKFTKQNEDSLEGKYTKASDFDESDDVVNF